MKNSNPRIIVCDSLSQSSHLFDLLPLSVDFIFELWDPRDMDKPFILIGGEDSSTISTYFDVTTCLIIVVVEEKEGQESAYELYHNGTLLEEIEDESISEVIYHALEKYSLLLVDDVTQEVFTSNEDNNPKVVESLEIPNVGEEEMPEELPKEIEVEARYKPTVKYR